MNSPEPHTARTIVRCSADSSPRWAITPSTTSDRTMTVASVGWDAQRPGVALRVRRTPGRCRAAGSPTAAPPPERATVQHRVPVVASLSRCLCKMSAPSGGFGRSVDQQDPVAASRTGPRSFHLGGGCGCTERGCAHFEHIGSPERRRPFGQPVRAGQHIEEALDRRGFRERLAVAAETPATSATPEPDRGRLARSIVRSASRARRCSPWLGGSPRSRPAPLWRTGSRTRRADL